MAYTTFEAPRGTSLGMDEAAQMLAARMAQSGGMGDLSLLYRRDPRAAVALEQMRSAAAQSEADRMQRGDIAQQEMGYRNRSLDAQMREGGLDRQSRLDLLMAQLGGQRRLSTERMSFESEQADAARRAALGESAAQREFQRGQTAQGQTFTAGESRLGRQHATEGESRRAMLETMLKGMELAGVDKQQQGQRLAQMIEAYGNLAQSAADPGYAPAKAELDKLFKSFPVAGQPTTTQTAPAAVTGMDQFRTENPNLAMAWEAASTGEDKTTKKAMADFLGNIPTEDISKNREAMKRFLQLRYGEDLSSELSGTFAGTPKSLRKINEIRAALGLEPTASAVPGAAAQFMGGSLPIPPSALNTLLQSLYQ